MASYSGVMAEEEEGKKERGGGREERKEGLLEGKGEGECQQEMYHSDVISLYPLRQVDMWRGRRGGRDE